MHILICVPNIFIMCLPFYKSNILKLLHFVNILNILLYPVSCIFSWITAVVYL